MKKDLALVSGGFDPMHSGHIAYIKSAKKFSDYLIVGLNSDDWLLRKKKYHFLDWEERASIIENLGCVNQVIKFDDRDDSASDAISQSLSIAETVYFCNGGDRSNQNCQELIDFKANPRVIFKFGAGGEEKMNSSSWIIHDFYKKYSSLVEKKELHSRNLVTIDYWGAHSILADMEGYKFKELRLHPRSQLPTQKHLHREEFWLVHRGIASIKFNNQRMDIREGEYFHLPINCPYQLSNLANLELIILQTQRGGILEEGDKIIVDNDQVDLK